MSNTRDDGGPAFPMSGNHVITTGMFLRDYFAAKAMQAYASSESWRVDMNHEETARAAYHLADSMLKERAK